MENPGFLDIDQSIYDRAAFGSRFAMPHRRPHNLATLHHSHPHNAAVIAHAHHEGPHSNTLSHVHLANAAAHGLPATAHLHGGRVVGVTGVPGGHNAPAATPHGVRYADPGSIPSLYSAAPQPLYSCQAPRGHEHVYQCPGHRDQIDHHHSNNSDEHIEEIHGELHRAEHCDHRYIDHREHQVIDPRTQLDIRDQSADPEHRTEYHYGGSDYSSTEPIYAQPHLHPQEAVPSPSRTPPLAYSNIRGSLRTSSPRQHGTPARFLVRTDSTGASTSSSILPTVSALLSIDHPQSRPKTHTNEFSKSNSIQHHHTAAPSAKFKGTGMFGAWRAKYLRGGNGSKRGAMLLGLLVLLLLLVLGGLATVLYLTLGGGIGSMDGQTPQVIKLTEKGSSVVSVEFRILNQIFWPGLSDPQSDAFKILSESIEQEMDKLFLNSVWSREYNRSEVVSLAQGSLIVRAKIYLNYPDTSAAKKFGSAFLRGLQKREWLDRFMVDVSSIRFAEYLIDSAERISSTTQSIFSINYPLGGSPTTTTSTTQRSDLISEKKRPNVGWGEWEPWSVCNPCSAQKMQVRKRKCRLDQGKGLLVNIMERCLLLQSGANGRVRHLQSWDIIGDTQTRQCQCDQNGKSVQENNALEEELEDEEELLEEFSTNKTPFSTGRNRDSPTASKSVNIENDVPTKDDICEKCRPGEVCVALSSEEQPVCRTEVDPDDRTGCGGLCNMDTEVCQPLGSRAFQCHSASQCLDDEWRCKDGLCIPRAKRCDGHLNCYDRSDEISCKCSSNEFHCGNQTSCIPLSARCDGNVDCWDGLDEANCSEGTGDASQLSPSVIGVTRAGTTPMNRTAIGLSSLSHRERELLS